MLLRPAPAQGLLAGLRTRSTGSSNCAAREARTPHDSCVLKLMRKVMAVHKRVLTLAAGRSAHTSTRLGDQ